MVIDLQNKKYFIFLFSFIYLLFAKLGANPEMHLGATLPILAISTLGLTLISPPIATALVFLSHNLIGQITLGHPGFLLQIFPSIFLLLGLLFMRRKELKDSCLNWRNMRLESWSLCAIVIVFMIGSFTAILSHHNISIFEKITGLFTASRGGIISYYPYVFLSRWGIFIILGSLCCRGEKELKVFFLAFAIFIIAQLIAVPLSIYQWVLSDMCLDLLNITGLQALNVNRAYLGYLIACSSFIMLVNSIYEKKIYPFIFYFSSSLILSFLCLIAGSKGPVGALGLASIFLILRTKMKCARTIISYIFIFILLSTTLPFLFGCKGSLANVVTSVLSTSKSSVSVRTDLVKTQFNTKNFVSLFGQGLGASVKTTESTFVNPMGGAAVTFKTQSGSHNLFIDFFEDLGVVGLLIFFISIYVLVSQFFINLPKNTDGHMLRTLMGGVLIILLVYSLLATAPSMATLQALFVGLLFGYGIKVKNSIKKV